MATVLLYLATSRKHAGDVQAARTFVEEALGLSQALGDVWTRGACLAQRASIAFEAGELDTAIVHARAAVEACRQESNLRSQFVALQWLAGFVLLDGQSEPGHARAHEAFELSRTLGNVNLPDSLDQLALIAALRSDTSRAARLAGYADAYADRYGISRYGIALAIRSKLLERLYTEVTCDECQALMAEGAAWSEQEAIAAAHAV